jgi:hypothetical protein
LLLGTLAGLSRLSLPDSLQLERPLCCGLRSGSDLNLSVSGLKAKHLDFHRICSRRETVELVRAGLIGGGHNAVIALNCDYRGSRQRLAAELDYSRGRDRRLRTRGQAQGRK